MLKYRVWNATKTLKSIRTVVAARVLDKSVIVLLAIFNVPNRNGPPGLHDRSSEEALLIALIH